MKVLVTGGAGFIGSWIDQALIKKGHRVTVFDNLSTGFANQVPAGAKFFKGDVLSKNDLRRALKGQDAVIHLAAKSIVPESVKNPQETFDVNLIGGQNLLEVMRELGIKKIVYSSSAAVYGIPNKVPIEEDDPKWPISPYGASKLAFERILSAYHKNYGFDVLMFRYFNPFGPGEKHDPETHAIPNFIKATLQGIPIPIYWKGEQERDFFYVEDIAEAHVMGLEKDGFHYYNLGSGRSTKIIDVVKMIFEIAGKETSIDDLGERAGDSPVLMASIEKVKKELGWEPQTSLQDGLQIMIPTFSGGNRTVL